jgi:ubiquitin C-terminal hydrolase
MTTITYTFTKTTSSDGFKLLGRTSADQRATEPLTALVLRVMKISQEAAEAIRTYSKIKVVILTKDTTSVLVKVKKSKGVYFTFNIPKLSPETISSLRPLLHEKQPSPPEQPAAAAKSSITEPIALEPPASTSLQLPPGIYNPNTNCFMNATFQMVMNDTELRRALIETFRAEQEKCKADLTKKDITIGTLNQQIAEFQSKSTFYWFFADYQRLSKNLEEQKSKQADLQKLSRTYEAFFKAFENYDNGGKETINLTPLRHLLTIYPGSGSSGQCDAEEFFNALFNNVKLSNYKIGYEEAFERTYAPLDPESKLAKETYTQDRWSKIKKADLIQLQSGNKTKNSNGTNITLTLDLEDAIKKAKEAKKTEEVIKISGQELLDTLFMPRNVKDPASPTACTDGYYVMQTEKKAFEKPPQRFLVHLKRFTFEGAARKISELVSMPELITIEKKHYRLKTIIHHLGGASGGHYIGYLKKDNIWIKANDSSVSIAEKSAIDEARENGYLYLYEEWQIEGID